MSEDRQLSLHSPSQTSKINFRSLTSLAETWKVFRSPQTTYHLLNIGTGCHKLGLMSRSRRFTIQR